jgi:hypothetical protein
VLKSIQQAICDAAMNIARYNIMKLIIGLGCDDERPFREVHSCYVSR